MNNTNPIETLFVAESGDIRLGHREVLTAEKRKEIYKVALDIYSCGSFNGSGVPGICNSLHYAGVKLQHWAIHESPKSLNFIGFNEEFVEILEAAKRNDAELVSFIHGGYWWNVLNYKIRIKVLKEAIELVDQKIKNNQELKD